MAEEVDHIAQWDFDNVTSFVGAAYLVHQMDVQGKAPMEFHGQIGPLVDEFIKEFLDNNETGTPRMTEIAEDVNLMLSGGDSRRVH